MGTPNLPQSKLKEFKDNIMFQKFLNYAIQISNDYRDTIDGIQIISYSNEGKFSEIDGVEGFFSKPEKVRIIDRKYAMPVFFYLVHSLCGDTTVRNHMKSAFKKYTREISEFAAGLEIRDFARGNYAVYLGCQETFNAAMIATILYAMGCTEELKVLESAEPDYNRLISGMQKSWSNQFSPFIKDIISDLLNEDETYYLFYAFVYSEAAPVIADERAILNGIDKSELADVQPVENETETIFQVAYKLPSVEDTYIEAVAYQLLKDLREEKGIALRTDNLKFSTFAYSAACCYALITALVNTLTQNFVLYISEGLEDKIEKDKEEDIRNNIPQVNSLKTKVSQLEEENKKKQQTINKLSKELEFVKKEYDKLVNPTEEPLSDAHSNNNVSEDTNEPVQENKTILVPIDKMIEYISGKKVIIVGGGETKSRAIEELLPNARIVYHDQYNRANVDANTDMVFILTAYISHALSKKYVRGSRQTGVPLTYIKDNNIEMIIKNIYNSLQNKEKPAGGTKQTKAL